jgi:hypothetical protein
VACSELLGGQRRPKIGVLLPEDGQNVPGERRLQAAVTGSVSVLGDQPDGTFGSVPKHQPLDLPHRQPEPFCGSSGLQITVDNRLDRLQPFEFAHRKCHPGFAHGQPPKSLKNREKRGPEPPNATFLSSQKRTFLNGRYLRTSHNLSYVKS